MEPIFVALGQDIEEKRLRVVEERFVVEKHFSKHANVLAVDLHHIESQWENLREIKQRNHTLF
jgi:hypothetical protein